MVWRPEVPNVSRCVKDKACHVKDSHALRPAPLAERLALPLSSVPLPCQPHRSGAGPDTESGQRETEAKSRPLLQRLQALCPPQPSTCTVQPPVGAPSLLWNGLQGQRTGMSRAQVLKVSARSVPLQPPGIFQGLVLRRAKPQLLCVGTCTPLKKAACSSFSLFFPFLLLPSPLLILSLPPSHKHRSRARHWG